MCTLRDIDETPKFGIQSVFSMQIYFTDIESTTQIGITRGRGLKYKRYWNNNCEIIDIFILLAV